MLLNLLTAKLDRLTMNIATALLVLQYHGPISDWTQAGVQGQFVISGLPRKKFVQLADINIGVLASVSERGNSTLCTELYRSGSSSIFPEVVAYAFDLVNRRNLLPPNLTLGFVILDDCEDPNVAAVQSLAFLPKTTCPVPGKETHQESYDVVAVLQVTGSSVSIAAANILGPAHIPQISFSTSDELSNKRKFPFFTRVIPPERHQFQAFLEILKLFGWSYISLLYEKGHSGRDAYLHFAKLLSTNDICLAVVRELNTTISVLQADEVARNLLEQGSKATVVVMILNSRQALAVVSAIDRLKLTESFIWLFSERVGPYLPDTTPLASTLADSLLVRIPPAFVHDFDNWFKRLTPNTTSNPWFHEHWEHLFNCSLANGTCSANLTASDRNLPTDHLASRRGYIIDAVFMIANATSRVLQSTDCSNFTGSAARKCISGRRLQRELQATRQQGFSGLLELDSNGDRDGKCIIEQLRADSSHLIRKGIYQLHRKTSKVKQLSDLLWKRHSVKQGFKYPLSVCSFPCQPHHAFEVQKVPCCWNCRKCDSHQRLENNFSTCVSCPPFYWPDPLTNYTTCMKISATQSPLTDLAQNLVALFCVLVCLCVLVFFQRYPEYPIMHTCCRELPFVILFSIVLGYATLVLFTLPPNTNLCRVIYLLYFTSFVLMYGPIFVRTLQTFCICHDYKNILLRSRQFSRQMQFNITFIIFAVQVGMFCIPLVTHTEWVQIFQEDPAHAFVENTCYITVTSLIAPLVYQLALVVACAVLAIQSTPLIMDPFKEIDFISVTVCTTFTIIVCFAPAFYVASRRTFKIHILALAILFNHTIALVWLFLAKIYILVYKCDVTFRTRTRVESQAELEKSIGKASSGSSSSGSATNLNVEDK